MRVEVRGLTKRFGPIVANAGIDLAFEPGEVHCLLGENGAGKSTLMNLLFGVIEPDAGEILVDGRRVEFNGPGDAIAEGIGMVHQHFTLVPTLTVAENVMLGFERTGRFGWLDHRRARADVIDMSERYGLSASPDALVGSLPVGLQQRVEIMKSLRRDAQLLILDEPTAALTPQESEELFRTVRSLRDSGRSIVFISHKLREVKAIADRVTVMRHGQVVGRARPDETENELASLMVGRSVNLVLAKAPAAPRAPVLEVTGLGLVDEDGRSALTDVSFEVRAGEIVAVSGVQGNGQAELAEALVGLRRTTRGTVVLAGREIGGLPTREILLRGVGYVPADRIGSGLIADLPLYENLILDTYHRPPFARGRRLQLAVVKEYAAQLMNEFDIRASSIATPVGTLSGGNQQKVLLARELSRPLRLLIAAEPTRGLDVTATEFVQRRILQARDGGAAIVLISSDLDETIALADRIAVMYRGQIVAVVPPHTSRRQLGLLMAGAGAAESLTDRPSRPAEVLAVEG